MGPSCDYRDGWNWFPGTAYINKESECEQETKVNLIINFSCRISPPVHFQDDQKPHRDSQSERAPAPLAHKHQQTCVFAFFI